MYKKSERCKLWHNEGLSLPDLFKETSMEMECFTNWQEYIKHIISRFENSVEIYSPVCEIHLKCWFLIKLDYIHINVQ